MQLLAILCTFNFATLSLDFECFCATLCDSLGYAGLFWNYIGILLAFASSCAILLVFTVIFFV